MLQSHLKIAPGCKTQNKCMYDFSDLHSSAVACSNLNSQNNQVLYIASALMTVAFVLQGFINAFVSTVTIHS